MDQRKRRGTVEYLVHWLGFDHDQDTWEPASNLPSMVVEEFEAQRAAAKPKRKKAAIKEPAPVKPVARSKAAQAAVAVSDDETDDPLLASFDDDTATTRTTSESTADVGVATTSAMEDDILCV